MPTRNPNVQFEWIANRVFSTKNLKAKKGQRLPDRWQHIELIRRLKDRYGAECVIPRAINPGVAALAEEIPPSGK